MMHGVCKVRVQYVSPAGDTFGQYVSPAGDPFRPKHAVSSQLTQPTLRAVQCVHNRCTESPATCFGTLWVLSSGTSLQFKVL